MSQISIQVLPIGLLGLILYIIIDFISQRGQHIIKRLIFYSFLFYLLNVMQVTTGYLYFPPIDRYVSIQPIPFFFAYDLVQYYQRGGLDWWFWNAFMHSFHNFIMLLPLGIYLPLLFNVRKIKKVALILFYTTLTIECYQLLFSYIGIAYRTFNVDDILLNTIGGLLGFALYISIEKIGIYLKDKFVQWQR